MTAGSNYSGLWNDDYFLEAVKELKTLQHISVREGIKTKLNLSNLDTTGTWAAANCDFTAAGSITTADRVLELLGLEIAKEVCFKDLTGLWDSITMGAPWPGDNAPEVFQAALIADMVGKAQAATEEMIWEGTAGANSFSGFIERFLADAAVNDVAAPVALTEGNIVDKLKLLITAAGATNPAVIQKTIKPNIYVAPVTARLYIYSQQTLGYLDRYNADNTIPMVFADGFQIIECPGLAANTMVCAHKDNLWFGTGSADQQGQMSIVDMRTTTNENKLRLKLQTGMNVQYRLGAEIGLYRA